MTGDRWHYDPVEGRVIDTRQEPLREWVSTRDALEHLRTVGLPPEANPGRLAQWAAVGLLPARALFLRNRNERLPEGSLMPTWVWKEVVEGLWVKLLDWQAGSLRLVRYNVGPTLDVEAHGIEFDKAALLRLAPGRRPSEAETVAPEGDQSTGRPTGSGEHSRTDESLFPRIQALMDEGKASSAAAAARLLFRAGELKGQTEESAVKRVVRKFRKRR